MDPVDVHSLVALTSYYNGYFEQCSRAFTKLETSEDCPDDKKEGFSELAMDIFTTNAPSDPAKVDNFGSKFCVASGKPLHEESRTIRCTTCKRHSLTQEIRRYQLRNCPLCHSPLGGAGATLPTAYE